MSSAATAQVHIDRALRLLGQIPAGEDPSTDETADALIALNAMVGSWIANRDFGLVTLTTYATAATSQTLPDGYDQAIQFNLALALAPEFEVVPRPEIIEEAKRSFALIRRAEAPAITETAAKIITKALRIIGHIGPDEAATTKELAYGLDSLNGLIGTWRTEKLMVWANQEESLTLADGDASYTVGPDGDLNTTRPVAIDAAWIVDSNTSYHVAIIDDAQYASIPDKTTESDWPDRLLYRPSITTGTVIVYPVPNATRTLKLLTRVVLSTFAATSTSISLPAGVERALVYNLAKDIAPEYGRSLSPEAAAIARSSKRAVKDINSRPIRADSELAAMFGPSRGNILSGEA